MEKGRNWLIITHACNLDGRAASQHIDDRLPYLKKEGITPLILSGPTGPPLTETFHVQTYSPAPSGLRFELGYKLRTEAEGRPLFRLFGTVLRFLALPFYLVEKIFLDVESQWSWFLSAGVRGYFLCKKYDPEIIYSTGGPFSAHIAAAMIAAKCGKTWIAELQDPLVHGDWQRSGRALRIHARVERLICKRADAVVFVTDGARRGASERTGLGNRGWAIHPGAVPVSVSPGEYHQGSSCRFAHYGSLAGSRNVDVFLAALERLFRERPDLSGSVRLDLYGSCDRHSLSRIEAFPFPDVVTVHGRLSRSESLSAMRKSDVLLLVQNTSDFSTETIPSKTYEYLQSGRPILGLVYRNPELAGMLKGLGHTVAEAADVGSVRGAVSEIHLRWEAGRLETRAGSPYTIASAVERLVAVAESRGPA
ncbi:MAG TPA: hypothetical protein DD658_00980 [Deltaproteobacteria bacterium]|nr:MAG: hypothetical protein A2X88_03140 [Deltaproteobacteria bacterium GWC2_65_14]HBO68792.1 hypothetical protein [Deltaproteobacteria bacterium]